MIKTTDCGPTKHCNLPKTALQFDIFFTSPPNIQFSSFYSRSRLRVRIWRNWTEGVEANSITFALFHINSTKCTRHKLHFKMNYVEMFTSSLEKCVEHFFRYISLFKLILVGNLFSVENYWVLGEHLLSNCWVLDEWLAEQLWAPDAAAHCAFAFDQS